MGGMDQESIRYDGNCSLQLPETSTHCSYCFGTFAALKNKVRSSRTPANSLKMLHHKGLKCFAVCIPAVHATDNL